MTLPTTNQLISKRAMRELVAAGELDWWGGSAGPTGALAENRMLTWHDLMYYTSNRAHMDGPEARLPSWAAVAAWRNAAVDWAGITRVEWFWTGNQSGYGYAVVWSAGALVGVTDWVYRHGSMPQPVATGGGAGGSYSTSYGMPENTTVTFTIYPRRRRTRDGLGEILHGSVKTMTLLVPIRPTTSPSYNTIARKVEFEATSGFCDRVTLEESSDGGAGWITLMDGGVGTSPGQTLGVSRSLTPGIEYRWRARQYDMDGSTQRNASPYSQGSYVPPPIHPTRVHATRLAERSFAVSCDGDYGTYSGYRFRWERLDSTARSEPEELTWTSSGGFNGSGEGTGPAPVAGHYYSYRARLETTDGSMVGAWSPWSAAVGPA